MADNGVQNLFDRNYFYQENYPLAGRTACVTLRVRF
jgi:outer membrane cobalamin receptor